MTKKLYCYRCEKLTEHFPIYQGTWQHICETCQEVRSAPYSHECPDCGYWCDTNDNHVSREYIAESDGGTCMEWIETVKCDLCGNKYSFQDGNC